MFKYKTEEELSKMSAAERDQYGIDKREHEKGLMIAAVKAGTDPLQAIIDAQKGQIEGLVKEVGEAKEKANQAIEAGKGLTLETIEQKVSKFIEENFDKIKALKGQGHGVVEFEIKDVATVTTGSATNPDGIPALVGVQIAPPKRVNLRTTITDGLVTSFNTSLAAYPYTESLPKDGDFAFVAEGTAKPQLDFKIETRYATPVKAAGWIHLTEESVQDIPGLQSIATGYLRDKHDLKRQRGILFGDGIAPNPKGATLYGRAFSAGEMANGVASPNFMDVVNASITDVYTTHNYQDEMPYMPSLVLINPVDFFLQLVSAKDDNGLPLYPSASLFNRVEIGGITILPEQDIPAGKIFVADMSKYYVSNYVGYTVKIGWINDDFIKNQFVILGESRFHAFVKKLDQQAFIYDDIATIKTAITAA
jgi:hypothetical protein